MAEEEKQETTEESKAEASDAEAAGPVAEDGPPAQPEDSSSTPAAEEASEPPAEAPPAEEAPAEDAPVEEAPAEEAPAADEPAAEAAPAEDPDADLPWKQRRRLERSRRPSEPSPQRSPEELAGQRLEERRGKAAARRRYRQAKRAKRGERGTGTPPAERSPNPPKVRQGVVVSDRADKTITVRIDIARRHPAYEKIVRRSRRLHAHDERNEAGEGDLVRIVETRPLSRTKRWRLLEVLQKAK
jgi:small subunit ribosomal protein S17